MPGPPPARARTTRARRRSRSRRRCARPTAVLSLGATTTIEHAVAEALVSGTFVEFDEAAFGMLYVPQLVAAPASGGRSEFERGTGDWKTVRVTQAR